MCQTIDATIEKLLIKKGYKWEKISIISRHYTWLYEVILDGKLVEFYNSRKNDFVD